MKRIVFIVLGFCLFVFAVFLLVSTNASNSYLITKSTVKKGTSTTIPTTQLYTNKKFGFQIAYFSGWTYREFEDGVGFRPKNMPNDPQYEYITLSILPKPGNILSLPFDQYVKVAASNEIQNYKGLASISSVSAQKGLVGYVTIWHVQSLGGGGLTTSQPITYFPSKDPTKTIEIFLNNKDYLSEYNSMIQTFNYQ